MRSLASTLGLLFLAVSMGAAQQPQPPAQPAAPTLDPARNPLDHVLVQWETRMSSVQNLVAKLNRTQVDRVFNKTDLTEGWAKYMKPNRAVLEMKKKGDTQIFEKFVFTGSHIFEFRPHEKKLLVHQPPSPRPGQALDDNVMSFVFGMKAEEAKRRYEMTLQKPEDPHYYYLVVQPRFPQDKQEFIMARLVLLKQTFLPRQFWYVEGNKNEITWDIAEITPNSPNVAATDFGTPQVPPGWKMEQAPPTNAKAGSPQPPPRVARPNQ